MENKQVKAYEESYNNTMVKIAELSDGQKAAVVASVGAAGLGGAGYAGYAAHKADKGMKARGAEMIAANPVYKSKAVGKKVAKALAVTGGLAGFSLGGGAGETASWALGLNPRSLGAITLGALARGNGGYAGFKGTKKAIESFNGKEQSKASGSSAARLEGERLSRGLKGAASDRISAIAKAIRTLKK